MKIVVTDDYHGMYLANPAALARLRNHGELVVYTERLKGEADAIERMRGAEIVIGNRERTPLTRAVLAALPDLKLLSMTGTIFANLDLEAATERGILVTRTPGKSIRSVAELTYGLILALCRRIAHGDGAIRRGEWPNVTGIDLRGKTLGVIGLGGIGSDVARIAAAFDMKVVAWGPTLTPERAAANGATFVSLHDLMRRADIVTIHLRLTRESRGILGATEIGLMKPTALLINTARGPIVDEEALTRALQERRIAGAGLDVFSEEPLPADSPLFKLDSVVLTPHVGWTTEGVFEQFVAGAVANVENYLAGSPTEMLNPQVWEARKRA